MPIMHNPDSAFAKESVKWEPRHSSLGEGLRAYVHREFPMMLHRAGNLPGGGIGILSTTVVGGVQYREDGMSKIPIAGVPDEQAYQAAHQMGFRETPLEAIAAFEAEQLEFAKLHAEREYEKRHKLSPNAVAEVEAVEAERGSVHLPTIPEAPKQKRRYVRRNPEESAKRATEGSSHG